MVFSNSELFVIFGILLTAVTTVVNYVSFYRAVLARQLSWSIAYGLMTCLLASGLSSNVCVYTLYVGGTTPVSAMDLIAPFVLALLVLVLTGTSLKPETPSHELN